MHRLRFRPDAKADLDRLYDYIAGSSGPETAGRYIDRIEAACAALTHVPEQGTRRDDLAPGMRTMGFERRATIAFRVLPGEVEIVRVFYGGRDVDAHLRGAS